MDRLRARVKDKRVCALVKAFLKSGVLTELGDREESPAGTPQGGDHDSPNASGNFCFEVTLGYRRCERPRRAGGSV